MGLTQDARKWQPLGGRSPWDRISTSKVMGRLSVRLVNDKDKGYGSFVTPYLPGEFRTTPLVKNVPYAWTLTYDPPGQLGPWPLEFSIKCIRSNAQHHAVTKQLADEWKAVYEKLPRSREKLDSGHYGRQGFRG